jgi:glycosyltransferase involved in cell wall biosynthesis
MQADHMHGLGSKVKFKISQRGLKLASLVVVPSEYFRLYVHQQYAIDDINIVVSPSGGVDTDSFAPTKKTQTSSYISLGYVGRLDAGKGVDTLLNAMALLKDKSHYRLDIIGSGELELTLKNKVEQLALQNIVCFKGVLAHHELPDFLNVFDYLVFPTQLNESLGLVGLEAMACGVPIITTGLAGVSDYFVDGENGIGFSAGNEEELATVIDKLSEVDVAGYKVLQTNARNMAERFDQKKVNADLLAAINQVR